MINDESSSDRNQPQIKTSLHDVSQTVCNNCVVDFPSEMVWIKKGSAFFPEKELRLWL